MDEWQKLRLARAADQDMVVTHLDCTEDAFVFTVQGMTGNYLIEIAESVHLWPPTCGCDDYFWRPGILCKHILLCFAMMGVDEEALGSCDWEPRQDELYEILSNAPNCRDCTWVRKHDSNKQAPDK